MNIEMQHKRMNGLLHEELTKLKEENKLLKAENEILKRLKKPN
jgi:hypothetical protein